MLSTISGNLVRASVEGALVVAIVWVLTRLLRRLSPATCTLLWWCAAAKFMLALAWTAPVQIPILPGPVVSIQEAPAPVTAAAAGVTGMPGADRRTADPVAGPSAVSWTMVLVAAWSVGVAVAAGAGVRRWRQVVKLVSASSAPPAAIETMAVDLARRLGLRRVPRVRMSDGVRTPLVLGMFRPCVLLPADAFEVLPVRQQQMALCHELTHVKRADLWLGCVPAIAERVFFFHPLVNLAAREYALCREAACDARVLAVLDAAPQEYGRLLLALGLARPRATLAAAGAPWSFSTLKRRIAMLDGPSSRSIRSRLAAVTVVGIAVLATAPVRLSARPPTIVPAVQQAPRPAVEFARVDLAAQKERDLNYVMFINDHNTTMSGSMRDIERARRYRRSGERLLWFRHDGREYVIRDPQILDEVAALWVPVGELGEKQGKLGSEQGELGAKQGELGARRGRLGAEQGVLGALQGTLGARQGVRAAREGGLQTEAERRKFEEEGRLIEREMRELDVQMRALDAKMRELEKPMDDLSEQMEALGKQMEAIGLKMEEEQHKAEARMRTLLERSIASGAAQQIK
jgi:bla regulator protein BlaR1